MDKGDATIDRPSKSIASWLALDEILEFMAAKRDTETVEWVPAWHDVAQEIRTSESALLADFLQWPQTHAGPVHPCLVELASSDFIMSRAINFVADLMERRFLTVLYLELRINLLVYAVHCGAEHAFRIFRPAIDEYWTNRTQDIAEDQKYEHERFRRKFFLEIVLNIVTVALRGEFDDRMLRVIFDGPSNFKMIWQTSVEFSPDCLDSWFHSVVAKSTNFIGISFLIDRMTIVHSTGKQALPSKFNYSLYNLRIDVLHDMFYCLVRDGKIDLMILISHRLNYEYWNASAIWLFPTNELAIKNLLEYACLCPKVPNFAKELIVTQISWTVETIDRFVERISQFNNLLDWATVAQRCGQNCLEAKLIDVHRSST